MTTRKDYEKPSTKVFMLQQQPTLLAGSSTSTGEVPSGRYPGADDPFGF